MIPVHEIGFLVLSGALGCWGSPAPEPCPLGDSIQISAYEKPDLHEKTAMAIGRSEFGTFRSSEVGYEERGFAVFKTQGADWFQVSTDKGQKLWIHVPSTEKKFREALGSKEKSEKSWMYRSLEEIFKGALPRVAPDGLKLLKKKDLKIQVADIEGVSSKVRDLQMNELLEKAKLSLPESFVEVVTACVQQETAPGIKTGSCEAAPKIEAFENPDPKRPGRPISMTWANWVGKPLPSGNEKQNVERLYGFGEKGEWLKIRVAFGNEGFRWVKKKDLGDRKIQSIPVNERLPAFLEILESRKSDPLYDMFKQFAPQPGFRVTGQSKWSSDGIFWVEVEVLDHPNCDLDVTQKPMMKGWLPYKTDGTSDPIVMWSPRGC